MTAEPAGEPSLAPEPGSDERSVPGRPRVSTPVLVVVGLAVGLLVGGLAVVASGGLDRGDDVPGDVPVVSTVDLGPTPSALAADRLVTAIRRSRLATFSLTEEYRRVAPDGQEVIATLTTRRQRPPDSLVRTDRTLELVAGGRRTSCATAPDTGGRLRCRSEAATPVDVEAGVREEAAILAGPGPLYSVGEIGAGCFQLVLRVERIAPPYGRRARLCYDPATGAPASSDITKAVGDGTEIVDRTRATEIRATVVDADLAGPTPDDVVP